MQKDYTLIGFFSFLLGFIFAFPVGGFLWLVLNRDQKFANFFLFKVYSLQSMIILTFFLIFLGSAAYFYFRGIPSFSSILSRFKRVPTAEKPSTPKQTPPTIGA